MCLKNPAQEGTPMSPAHTDDTELHARLPGDCQAVSGVLSRIGDKWSLLVVMLLDGEPRRFNELKRMIGGISQRMLSLTLRGLERDGFVTRTVFATVPPRVDYELTELGRSLQLPVKTLGMWAFGHLGEIEAARKRFDGASEQAGKAVRAK
jgi:DNA-binding HxlR family transcriptional regulator